MLRQKSQKSQKLQKSQKSKKIANKAITKKKLTTSVKRHLSTKTLASKKSPFTLTPLPYANDAITGYPPILFQYHHGKHHNTYVTNLNNLVKDTPLAEESLENIIRQSKNPSPIFNNSAQHFNHAFFWHCMKPNGGGLPTGTLANKINQDFGSFEEFREKFKTTAVTHFGSGWAFLVLNKDKKLTVESHHDASTPFVNNSTPLLAIDVWEHGYYLEYKNDRATFVDSFLNKMVNWDFAQKNLDEAV
jgi:Fe-Mn family superoxide dismutase